MTTPGTFRVRLPALAILTIACTLFPACQQKDQELGLIPVSGKVTVGGVELPAGNVAFHPDEAKGNTSKKIPSGRIQTAGTYKLMTATGNGSKEGAPAGWYKVTVTQGASDQDKGKVEIPKEYQEASKSKLLIEVKEGAPPSTYDLKLKK